ncbi:hypothetical protein T07_406 [Trichinella nelsoni]|uniref:Uncharacterized protein n=1 Tax=Trichinella nelsoni TaxID=6336 RepID=A0A0V0S4A8_9BILA|nr:hypothetical protein T07_406 [Trichinella nelsoni]
MPGLGLPADSCFDSDAFQFCAVSRLSATPFRSAIIFSRRFHFTLLPLLNTEAVGCDDFPFHRRNIFLSLRTAVSNSILSINNWSYCNDGFVYAVLLAGRPAGLPACLPAAQSLAGLLWSLVSGLSGRRARRGDQCPRASKFRAI